MFTKFDKALVALIGACLTIAGMTPWGHILADPGTQASLISIATAMVVYLVPNKVQNLGDDIVPQGPSLPAVGHK